MAGSSGRMQSTNCSRQSMLNTYLKLDEARYNKLPVHVVLAQRNPKMFEPHSWRKSLLEASREVIDSPSPRSEHLEYQALRLGYTNASKTSIRLHL